MKNYDPRIDLANALALGALLLAVIGLVVFISLCSCEDDDGCTPEDLRCSDRVLEICNANHEWDTVINCAAYEPEEVLVCCVSAGEPTCAGKDECDE